MLSPTRLAVSNIRFLVKRPKRNPHFHVGRLAGCKQALPVLTSSNTARGPLRLLDIHINLNQISKSKSCSTVAATTIFGHLLC